MKVLSVLMAIILFSIAPLQTFAQTQYKLARGTKVNISTTHEITSSSIGDVPAVVTEDVYDETGKAVLIEQGTQVNIKAVFVKNGAIGKAGQITLTNATTQSVDGKIISLNNSYDVKGKSKKGAALGLGIGIGCITGLGLLFLLLKGENAVIPANTTLDNVAVDRNYEVTANN